MKNQNKPAKGEYGYLAHKKAKETLHFLLIVLMGVGIFVVGLALNKWQVRNIFTVLAVLTVLPAAKVFVSLVILIPFRPMKKEEKDVLEQFRREDDEMLYDLVFTSSEHVMHLDALLVTGHQAVGLNMNSKKPEKVEEYFKKEFSARNLEFIYYQAPSVNAFESRLKKRSANETLSERQQADRKEFMELIKTAIV